MTFFEIFNQVKDIFMKVDVSDYQGHLALQINMTGEGEGIFYVELNNGMLSIEPYEYHGRDVMFTIDSNDFIKILNGKLDPIFAFTVGKLKIDGDLGKALEIQKFIKK